MNDSKNIDDTDVDEFLGLLVHSYNNHLAAMMGFTEIALLESEQKSLQNRLSTVIASGNDAVILGNNVLASIGRLQMQISELGVLSLVDKIKKLSNVILTVSPNIEPKLTIKTQLVWFMDCIDDLCKFVQGYSKQDVVKIAIELKEMERTKFVEIRIKSNIVLTEVEAEQLFKPFYSSRQLLDTKDLGLAKAKGFFGQIQSKLCWKNSKGFILQLPVSE